MKKLLLFLLPWLAFAQTNVQKKQDGTNDISNGPVSVGSSNVLRIKSGGSIIADAGAIITGFAGGGAVTSVGLSLPSSILTVSGSPVTTSGTLTGSLATQTANTVWAGPTIGSPAVPTFRILGLADLPSASAFLDTLGTVRGSIPYRGLSSWGALVPGTTGYSLVSNGSSADPSYQVVSVAGGGTNLTSGITGSVPFFNSSSTMGDSAVLVLNQLMLGGGSTGPTTLGSLGTTSQVLHGNAGGAPSFASVSLTSDISGILGISNGGTSASTANGALNALLPTQSGHNGQVLATDGTNTSWSAASGSVTGPGSSTNNAVAKWNGTTGAVLANSGVLIDSSNNVTGAASIAVTGSANTLTISGSSTGIPLTITPTGSDSSIAVQMTSKGTYYPVQIGEFSAAELANIQEFHATPAVPGGPVTPTDFLINPKASASNGWSGQTILSVGDNHVWGYLEFLKGQGTIGTPTAVGTGNLVGEIAAIACDSAGHYRVSSLIDMRAIGTISGAGVVPGQIEFTITDSTGAFNQAFPSFVFTADGMTYGTGAAVASNKTVVMDLFRSLSATTAFAKIRNDSSTGAAAWRAYNDTNKFVEFGEGGSARSDVLVNRGYMYSSNDGLALISNGGTSQILFNVGGLTSANTWASLDVSGVFSLLGNIASTSTSTGTLVVTGGIAATKASFLGGNLTVTQNVASSVGVSLLNAHATGAATLTLNDTGASGRSFTVGSAGSTNALTTIRSKFFVYDDTASSVLFTIDSAALATFTGALSVTGHTTFEGVTSTGATGSGNLVYATSPTFTTPALGTPSSGVATNLTGTASGLTAGAATVLATARTIGGSSFDGSANVTSFPAPGAIGGTTPSTGLFTTVGVGTGTTAPSTTLHVVDTGTATPRGITNDQYNTGTNGAQFNTRKARGTFATPTTIVTADLLGRFLAWGHDGTNFIESGNLVFRSSGTIAATRVPSQFEVWTSTDAAPSVLTKQLTIDNTGLATFTVGGSFGGNLTIGTSNVFTAGTIELGAASDTTLARVSAGVMSVEGNTVFTAATKADVLEAATFAADAGSTDDYAITLSPAITAYVTGAHYWFKANTANTGAATININSLGAKTIVKVGGGITTALADNDIRVGQWVHLSYDGTNMQMMSQLGNASSSSGANPTASVGLSAVNGSASTFLRSDGAPALDQTIAPTWTGIHTFTPALRSSGSAAYLTINEPADTGLTASTEAIGISVVTGTRQHATGAITTQRELVVAGPTYSFVGASTITYAATIAATPPVAGTNATLTYAIPILGQNDAIATTVSPGLAALNTTAATGGATAQWSPTVLWGGAAWKSNATAASQASYWRMYATPTTGSSVTTCPFLIEFNVAAAGWTTGVTITPGDSFKIGGSMDCQINAVQYFKFGSGSYIGYSSAGGGGGHVLKGDNGSSTYGMLAFGGTTSSFAAIKRVTTALQVRLADDSDYGAFVAKSLKTDTPNGGTADTWKLGTVVTGVTSTFVTTNYVQVDIAGTLYKLATVTSVP